MANVREFILVNAEGKQLSLLDKDTFGSTPTGLGVDFDSTYFSANGSFVKDKDSVKQNTIKLSIVYGYVSGKPYSSFDNVIQILNRPPLTLQYVVPFVGAFSRDVDIKTIEKGEMSNEYNVLMSDATFAATSPWYEWLDLGSYAHIPLDPGYNKWMCDSDTTLYSATYPYIYQNAPTAIQNYLDIDNDSVYLGFQTDSPLKVSVNADASTGVISNPGWELYDDSGFVVQNERIMVDIPVNYTLVLNTDYKDREISLVAPDGTRTDVSNLIDPTAKGFMRIPLGHYRLQLDSDTQGQVGGFGGGRVSAYLKKERMVV